MRIFVAADTHGDFSYLQQNARKLKFTYDDIVIILGDVGINYFYDTKDLLLKRQLQNIHATVLCVHGNHDIHYEYLKNAEVLQWNGGTVYFENDYPHIIYLVDEQHYKIGSRKFYVLGGAATYRADFLKEKGWNLFKHECLTTEELTMLHKEITGATNGEDIILTHTCPYSLIPVTNIPINMDMVNYAMEKELQYLYDNVTFNHWYIGHWRKSIEVGKCTFVAKKMLLKIPMISDMFTVYDQKLDNAKLKNLLLRTLQKNQMSFSEIGYLSSFATEILGEYFSCVSPTRWQRAYMVLRQRGIITATEEAECLMK